MSSILDVNKPKLPSFKEWIERHSPGTQADGFADLADLAFRSQDQTHDHLDPQQKSFARMWMGATIAAVELCNMEAMTHGRPQEEIIATLPRVLAAAAMYAIASVTTEDAPFRDFAKMITGQFRDAAMTAADGLEEQRNSTVSP